MNPHYIYYESDDDEVNLLFDGIEVPEDSITIQSLFQMSTKHTTQIDTINLQLKRMHLNFELRNADIQKDKQWREWQNKYVIEQIKQTYPHIHIVNEPQFYHRQFWFDTNYQDGWYRAPGYENNKWGEWPNQLPERNYNYEQMFYGSPPARPYEPIEFEPVKSMQPGEYEILMHKPFPLEPVSLPPIGSQYNLPYRILKSECTPNAEKEGEWFVTHTVESEKMPYAVMEQAHPMLKLSVDDNGNTQVDYVYRNLTAIEQAINDLIARKAIHQKNGIKIGEEDWNDVTDHLHKEMIELDDALSEWIVLDQHSRPNKTTTPEAAELLLQGIDDAKAHVLEELGDIYGILVHAAIKAGFSMQQVEERELAKLKERYPDNAPDNK